MALKLTLPSVSERANPDVEVRGVYVEEWIESLPYADRSMLMRQLLEALRKLNRSPVKPSTRLSLMELYAQPYHFVLERPRTSATSTIAFEKHRTDAQAAKRIATELAYGYKLALAHSLGKRSLFSRSKDSAMSIQRAILFLSYSLLHSFDEYVPAPKGVWREIFELYRYATDNQLVDVSLLSTNSPVELQRPIDTTFKQTLLTALIDPYHLSEGAIWSIHELLGPHAGGAQITAFASDLKPAGRFLLDFQADHRPAPYQRDFKHKDLKTWSVIDANPVIDALQNELKQLQTEDHKRPLFSRMIRSLSLPPKRHSPREATVGQVNLATGLTTIHHLLSASPRLPSAAPISDEGIEIGDTQEELILSGPNYQTEYWELVDRGPSGIGIFRRDKPSVPVRVGDVLGLNFASTSARGDLSIAVVRWMSIADEREYHVGAQILAAKAQAVTLITSTDENTEIQALAIPTLVTDKRCTVLAPKGVYANQRSFTITGARISHTVAADKLIEAGDYYDRFSFRVA